MELKFRAWDKDRNRMVYGIDLCSQDEEFHPVNGDWSDIINITEYEIMQFTGLHDRNGKEIWESDLLKTPGNQILSVNVTDLIWGDSKFHNISVENCEVIGNIWENPELLNSFKDDSGEPKPFFSPGV